MTVSASMVRREKSSQLCMICRLLKHAGTSGEVRRRDRTSCQRAIAIFFSMVSNCIILLFFLSQREMRTSLGVRERE